MSEIEGCPLCGNPPQHAVRMEDGWHYLACYNGHVVEVGGESADECIAAWNRRETPMRTAEDALAAFEGREDTDA